MTAPVLAALLVAFAAHAASASAVAGTPAASPNDVDSVGVDSLLSSLTPASDALAATAPAKVEEVVVEMEGRASTGGGPPGTSATVELGVEGGNDYSVFTVRVAVSHDARATWRPLAGAEASGLSSTGGSVVNLPAASDIKVTFVAGVAGQASCSAAADLADAAKCPRTSESAVEFTTCGAAPANAVACSSTESTGACECECKAGWAGSTCDEADGTSGALVASAADGDAIDVGLEGVNNDVDAAESETDTSEAGMNAEKDNAEIDDAAVIDGRPECTAAEARVVALPREWFSGDAGLVVQAGNGNASCADDGGNGEDPATFLQVHESAEGSAPSSKQQQRFNRFSRLVGAAALLDLRSGRLGRSGKVVSSAAARAGEGLLLDLQDEASATALLFETRGEDAATAVKVESSVDKVTWVMMFAALDVSPGMTTAVPGSVCPTGFEKITTAAECQQAANALGKPVGGSNHGSLTGWSRTNVPGGCLLRMGGTVNGEHVDFNENLASTAGHPDRKVICKPSSMSGMTVHFADGDGNATKVRDAHGKIYCREEESYWEWGGGGWRSGWLSNFLR